MVDLEGHLVAVDGLGLLREDAAGVVGEHVDGRTGGVELGREPAHLVEHGEVGDQPLDPELVGDRRRLLRRAPDDDDPVSVGMQQPRGRRTDPVARPGDDDRLRHAPLA